VPHSFAFFANEWAGASAIGRSKAGLLEFSSMPSRGSGQLHFLTFDSYRSKDSRLPYALPRARSC
jgi:hypothetical protein